MSSTAKKSLTELQGMLMSHFHSETTGIAGAVICAYCGEFSEAERQHGPRLEVVLGDRLSREGLLAAVPVTLTDPPKVIGTLPDPIRGQAVEFVRRNRDALLQHWDCESSTHELSDLLQGVADPGGSHER